MYFFFCSPSTLNSAERIHDSGDLCKYRNIRQAQGGPGASPSTHPTLETNNQATIKTIEIVEEPQTDQCHDDDCRDRNCLITDHHD